ncbi:endonuclease/exonuclease/phosphatase family protein [Nonomuraea sp. NPDC049486]|uniref:endonuclease/exonuclease/phosphatase family protein n=1 Tax=Nonomuraea sp. NPDC049486 TaxID=3155773 RepID=UPI003448052B
MNYNLCGAVCNHGETGVVDMVHSKIQAEQPDVVTLQETCRSQAERLQELLGDAGYKSYFSSSRFWPPAEWEWWPPDLTPTCDTVAPYSAGNAIFVRADISDADDLQFSTGRGIGCVTAAFEIRTRVCTLHGTPDDPTAAKETEELATDLFPPHLRRMPFILTGDVNVAPDWPSPENPAVGRLYAPEAGGTGDYWEVDQFAGCPGCPPKPGGAKTHPSEGKIDYIFVSKAHFDRDVSARVENEGDCVVTGEDPKPDDGRCSDHDILWGEVTLRVNEPVRVFQFNVCGAKQIPQPSCANSAVSGAVPAIASSILDFRPDLVTLNEVCRDQYDKLLETVRANGYDLHGEFAITRSPASKCGGSQELGNALLSHTPLTNPAVTPLPQGGEPETYNLTCADTTLREQTVRGCVTQLSAEAGLRTEQAEAVAAQVDAGVPVILGGDFQDRPWEAALTPLYAHHGGTGVLHEVDETDTAYFASPEHSCPVTDRTCRTGEGTVPLPVALQHKRDYIFVSDHFAALDGDATRTSVSSHVPLRGWATLMTGDGGVGGGGPSDPPPGQNLPPTVSAGPDVSGTEGQRLRLHGSVGDPDSTPTITWSYTAGEADPGTTCSFGDAHAPSTTISCTDDGTFTVTLTASDGVNAPVSDSARVRLRNAPLRPSITGPAPWSVHRAGTQVSLTAPFTDPGANDTHTCAIVWDDGRTDSFAATSGGCDRAHTFTDAGMYTVTVKVTDDDGGEGTASVMVIVYDPEAGFVTAGTHLESPAGALTSDPSATGRAHFQFNPKYHKSDTGPVPSGGKVSARLTGTDFDLDATGLEWLVITPDGKAAVKGKATVAGRSGYGFVLYGHDEPDRLRLVVWPLSQAPYPGGPPAYDNRRVDEFDIDRFDPQAVTGGNITVHH